MPNKIDIVKVGSIALVVILVLNAILFAARIVSGTIFWIVIIISAILAYKVLPKLRSDL